MALSYQWFIDDAEAGDDSATFTGTADATSGVHPVYCDVSNEAGTTKSTVVNLTVVDVPVITTQPTNQTVGISEEYTFTIVAENG